MNANFKPLGLAAAVATVAAGYAGVANAQSYAADTELGDLAIVPYYTVMDGYATGVNIINTANETQVIKFRFRRADDSMDALDFNVVLSPYDMYTGFLSMDANDTITWTSNDNSCAVPAYTDGNKYEMPGIYRAGAETGYIEIISMGSAASDAEAIAINAKHGADGMPLDCDLVRSNFFQDAVAPTGDSTTDAAGEVSTYVASSDSLKVSYFIKSDETGVEFGDNAVHIAGFMEVPSITNQEFGIFSGDLNGFDYPDLNGSSLGAGQRGSFAGLRTVLAAEELINDWSANNAGEFSVDTDWVITYPGQYTMMNLPGYFIELTGGDECTQLNDCDYRDIPMVATFTVYDREEQGIVAESGQLVVSPQPPVVIETLTLDKEVNVIQWGEAPVLNAPVAIKDLSTPDGAKFGWSSLVAAPMNAVQGICDWTGVPAGPTLEDAAAAYGCAETTGSAPVVGFVAWQRNFAALPAANYGRIVEHSRVQSAVTAP